VATTLEKRHLRLAWARTATAGSGTGSSRGKKEKGNHSFEERGGVGRPEGPADLDHLQ